MAYEIEKSTGDIVIGSFENGIAPSPHKGIANIQNANLSTEVGEVVNSFARVQDSMTETNATGTLSYLSTDHVNLSISGTNNLFKGNWITVTSSSNTGELPNGTYYIPPSTGAGFELAKYYNTANFVPPVTVTVLAVAGGGGGDGAINESHAGGGGGGQVLPGTASVETLMSYPITVGAGGAVLTAGSNTTAFSLTSTGGAPGALLVGGASGSGNAGGAGNAGGGAGAGGGGGGDSAAGSPGTQPGGNAVGGNGGNGTASSISGSSVTYGGGGGGGAYGGSSTKGIGGTGGGGNGGQAGQTATAGTANTGGGGGGGGASSGSSPAAAGGSGIVIISAPIGMITSATGGTHTTSGGNDIWTFTTSGTWTPTIPTTTVAPILTGFTTGLIATIQLAAVMGKPIAKATETYFNNGITYHRYYILDNQNLVWVYDDQNEVTYSSSDGVGWFLPDTSTTWCIKASGIGVISGFLVAGTDHGLFGKSVVTLGNTNSVTTTWVQIPDLTGWNGSLRSTTIPHFCYVGHQGTMYVTDASYILNLFPDATIADTIGLAATTDNVQSFCSWTVTDTNDGLYSIISGATPVPSDNKRVPVVFFTANDGVLPYSLTTGTVYYITPNVAGAFQVYTASTGGSTLDISIGSSGMLYFNTFYPLSANSDSLSSSPTYALTPQRLSLPKFEVAQCMAEIGNNVIIGCLGNTLYPWDQIQNLPASIISMPESNTVSILTVNQMGYVFIGNKGNIYITDGNVASAVTTVPDYTAGIPGIPSSYIEPYFSWGDSMYLRGRVYFSILDQTSTKAGNCGGIWSFTPTQNLYIGQDVGLALRLENQSSYGTYNGVTTVLIPKVNQAFIGPQYFSGWESSITSPTYGIDATGTGTATTSVFVLETDLIPTGTMLNKQTFEQIEYKLATPALTGDTITLSYRKDLTSAWKSCGTVKLENNNLSGYVSANFEKTQWTQIQAIGTPGTSSSFVRLTKLRLR